MSCFEFCRKCCHFFGVEHTDFCLAFLCPINVVEHRQEHKAILKSLWIDPDQVTLKMFSMSIRLARTWWCVPNELNVSGCQVQFFVKSVFVPYFIQCCCPIVGWILTIGMFSSPAIPAYCVHLCVRSVFVLVVARTVLNLMFLGNCRSSPLV